MKIALLQMTSGADMAANIARFEALAAEAAGRGAEFIATPENIFLMEAPANNPHPDPLPKGDRGKWGQAEHPGVKAAAEAAKKHGVWLLVGSVAVVPSPAGGGLGWGHDRTQLSNAPLPASPLRGEKKTYNRSILFNPEGEVAAQYDKIHLFDVEVGDGQNYRESAKILPGDRAVVANIYTSPLRGEVGAKRREGVTTVAENTPSLTLPPSGGGDNIRVGLSICYDLRFPHLYRALAKKGAEILAVPAAFTAVTGEAHWHVLLRARAIENGCFVIAPAQCGTHPGNRKTFGHSLVVDPWGKVLADGGTQEGVVMADIDLREVVRVRAKIPSLEHDRLFDVIPAKAGIQNI